MCFVFRSDQEDSADRSYRFLESHSHFGCCCWRLPLTQCTPQPASLQSDGCVFVNTSHEDDPIQFRLVLHNYIIRTNTQRNQLLGLDFTSHFYILLVMSFWERNRRQSSPGRGGENVIVYPWGTSNWKLPTRSKYSTEQSPGLESTARNLFCWTKSRFVIESNDYVSVSALYFTQQHVNSSPVVRGATEGHADRNRKLT